MNEILLNASIADFHARLMVLDEVLKAVVMTHPFPLRIDQSLKESLPNLLVGLRDTEPTKSPSNHTLDFAEIEVRRWLEVLQARLHVLSDPKRM